MDIIAVLFIAFGLAMDAFAVSVTSGVTTKGLRVNGALKIAVFFGLFQAFMPLIGWLAGTGLSFAISGFDHWVAFGLLLFIGCKMIYESFKLDSAEKGRNVLDFHVLLVLAVATSIDALAVGMSFGFLDVAITLPVVVIGVVTFVLSLVGVCFGKWFGHLFENRIEIVGGLVLIGIGVKILLEHMIG